MVMTTVKNRNKNFFLAFYGYYYLIKKELFEAAKLQPGNQLQLGPLQMQSRETGILTARV